MHRLGVQKYPELEEKSVFWSSFKMLQVKKKHEKTLGSIFIPGKYPGENIRASGVPLA